VIVGGDGVGSGTYKSGGIVPAGVRPPNIPFSAPVAGDLSPYMMVGGAGLLSDCFPSADELLWVATGRSLEPVSQLKAPVR
jgi:hypothetical protein